MKAFVALFITLFLLFGCSSEEVSLHEGDWQGTLELVPGIELPFRFNLSIASKNKVAVRLFNADETIVLDEAHIISDSVILPMHIFDTQINAVHTGNSINGSWTKNYEENYNLPFRARPVSVPELVKNSTSDFNGKWRIKFENEKVDSIYAVGLFEDFEKRTKGTILTATGDYRYLEGFQSKGKMELSTFDGEHAFFFDVEMIGTDSLRGMFYSGNHYQESFWAVKDNQARLPNVLSITYLREGYDHVAFKFPDLDGTSVSFPNVETEGKVVLLQVFGTWCPNCMDETKFYSQWYERNKEKGVEIIALAYERKADFGYASSRVKKMKDKLKVNYQFLIAGIDDKVEAGKSLPMLNHVISFPTTIFIDRNGKVRRIHTGFTGPGTGSYYHEFVEDFDLFMEQLINEEVVNP